MIIESGVEQEKKVVKRLYHGLSQLNVKVVLIVLMPVLYMVSRCGKPKIKGSLYHGCQILMHV